MKQFQFFVLSGIIFLAGCQSSDVQAPPQPASADVSGDESKPEKIMKTPQQWREQLTAEQFRVLREKGTEPRFSSPLNQVKQPGKFVCAGCGYPLFDTSAKYDSGSGWPSFFKPIDEHAVEEHQDTSHGMVRTEVVCSRCDGHLGHVFPDGPQPTGLRYCINGVSLKHVPDDQAQSD